MQIEGRAFVVSGGAAGLGAACVRRLASRGALVVIADLNAEAGEALAAEVGEAARFVPTDVTETASVQRAVAAAQELAAGLAGAVHCAGIVAAARLAGRSGPHDLELFRRVVEVNLIGTFNVLRLAAAALASRPADSEGERGVIITTASISAFEGQIGQTAYAASKAGVAGMTLPAARELAQHGVRVMCIAPGVFDTALMAGMSDTIRESLVGQIPFPARFGRPEEFAALAESIIENRMLNGEVIRLDAALRMGPA